MIYIKKYKLFEKFFCNSVMGDREQTIKEICLELDDLGASVSIETHIRHGEIFIYNTIIDWGILKEYALRIKDYLGDDYMRFAYRYINDYKWYDKELNEKTKIEDCIKISAISILYKN